MNAGLSEVAQYADMDDQRKLIYVADGYRVKSFRYDTTVDRDEPLPKHTLNSKGEGPIMQVENGSKLLRAGKRMIEVWNVDTLPDHGPNGRTKIGRGTFSIEDDFRFDESPDLEPSTGTPAHSEISYSNGAREPVHWTSLRVMNGQILISTKDKGSCWLTDLEAGLKPTVKFAGHDGDVNGFSVSPHDANKFLTYCADGQVRLFDVRDPRARVVFNCRERCEGVKAALYIHVDGLPCRSSNSIMSL